MRPISATALLALATVAMAGDPDAAAEDAAAEDAAPLQVIELFTSQACSACPPADALLGRLAREDGVLALSYAVDYWDYLDWEDTLADPAFTARQKAYAKARGDRAIYTPQAVINGATHAIGSKRRAVREKLSRTGTGRGPEAIDLELRANGDRLAVSAGAAPRDDDAGEGTLWLVVFSDAETVSIDAGENEGRSVTYHNAVRRIEAIGRWHGEPTRVTVAMPDLEDGGCAVLLQKGTVDRPGRVLAAGRL